MRILFLTPDVPYPADQGGKLRNLALLKAAASEHQVDLVSFQRQAPAQEALQQIERICHRVELVDAPPPRPLWQRTWSFWFDALPDIAYRLESPEMRRVVWDICAAGRYDLVQIEGLEMGPFISAVRASAPRAGVIYDAHNAEMALQRSMWQADAKHPLRWGGAAYSFVQWSKLGTYERVMMNETDLVLATCEEDAAKLRGRHVDPVLVPNAVDIEAIPFLPRAEAPLRTLLFAGPLDYRPNGDAARWLAGAIAPRIRSRLPELRVRLVGRGTERLSSAAGVEGAGYVADFLAELRRADALLVPMRMGGGTHFKVLEAMAAGVPVVGSPYALRGIRAVPGEHALVARDPAEFVDACVRLASDLPLRLRLTEAARALVERHYSLRQVALTYRQALATARRLARSHR